MDPESPLRSFYPNRYEVDITDVSQLYQGEVLLPFIDEALLRKQFKAAQSKLTPEELSRNSFRKESIFASQISRQGQAI